MMDEIFVLADREDAPGGMAAGIHGTMGDMEILGILGMLGYGDAFKPISTHITLYTLYTHIYPSLPSVLPSFLPSFFLRCYGG